jgi:hypothetical protein
MEAEHASGYRAFGSHCLTITLAPWATMTSLSHHILSLPRKAALLLFEYHDTNFRVTMPGLLPLPAPQTRDAYIDVHGIVRNCEITELLVTLKLPNLSLRPRHCFVWWSTLK